jgi:putative chitinase
MSFEFDFTKEITHELLHNNPHADDWHEALVAILPKYDITTPLRVAAFMAQCGHESASFTALRENLNYRAVSLRKVFGKYFPTDALAEQYAKQPERIANRVYANRMDNGDEASGDGWKFRGRGLIQLTGRHNYTKFAESVDMTLDEAIAYLETFEGAVAGACWYWSANNLNKWCDAGDMLTLTKRINGGTIGLEDRIKHYNRALEILGGHAPSVDVNAPTDRMETLRKGSKGPLVKKMQEALGIGADGDFGPGTERALMAWQANNGLTPDGVAGPRTLGKLFG